jgi:hypothetical protein
MPTDYVMNVRSNLPLAKKRRLESMGDKKTEVCGVSKKMGATNVAPTDKK